LENEFHELEEKLNELQTTYNKSITERKKFEADAISASDELHETKFELKNADDKVNRNQNRTFIIFIGSYYITLILFEDTKSERIVT